MKTDAQRVRQLREARAWSQEQLAEIAGINVRTLQRVESSGGGSLETRMALAAALEVTPAQLCTPIPATDDKAPAPASDSPPPHIGHWTEIKILLWALFVALMLLLGYLFGRDLAQKKNREDPEARDKASTALTAPPCPTAGRQQPDNQPTTIVQTIDFERLPSA